MKLLKSKHFVISLGACALLSSCSPQTAPAGDTGVSASKSPTPITETTASQPVEPAHLNLAPFKVSFTHNVDAAPNLQIESNGQGVVTYTTSQGSNRVSVSSDGTMKGEKTLKLHPDGSVTLEDGSSAPFVVAQDGTVRINGKPLFRREDDNLVDADPTDSFLAKLNNPAVYIEGEREADRLIGLSVAAYFTATEQSGTNPTAQSADTAPVASPTP